MTVRLNPAQQGLAACRSRTASASQGAGAGVGRRDESDGAETGRAGGTGWHPESPTWN